jgi:hypothetical protein
MLDLDCHYRNHILEIRDQHDFSDRFYEGNPGLKCDPESVIEPESAPFQLTSVTNRPRKGRAGEQLEGRLVGRAAFGEEKRIF